MKIAILAAILKKRPGTQPNTHFSSFFSPDLGSLAHLASKNTRFQIISFKKYRCALPYYMAHSTSTVYPFLTLGSEFQIRPVVLGLSMKVGHDLKGDPKKTQNSRIFGFCAINP